jgi:CDGSH-type Zn-finger protein
MKDAEKPEKDRRIVVTKNGPYVVTGAVPLAVQAIVPDAEGASWDWKQGKKFKVEDKYALCRCGGSKNKPFCDGAHAQIGFDGKETASRAPFAKQAEKTDGPTLDLSDAEDLCVGARFCDARGKIWNLIEKTDDPEARALAIREANHCPSGRLVVHDKKGKPIEEPLAPSIGIVEDPPMRCSGPLWVRGGIAIESGDGKLYEKRNRVTLCRCGGSTNKPYCDGSHIDMKFRDGLLE